MCTFFDDTVLKFDFWNVFVAGCEHALLDGKFVPLRTELLNMVIHSNFATRNEHVTEIERRHRVIKELAHECRSTLPFEVLPKLLLVKMVNNCALWIILHGFKIGRASCRIK